MERPPGRPVAVPDANADTIYSWTIVDLTSGPMVVCSSMVTTSSASNKGSRGGSMTTQTGPPEPPEHGTVGMDGMSLPAVARYWWLTALRGLVALALGVAVAVAGRGSARLVTFLALFWLTGGLITLRFRLAIRPRPGFRLGLAAAIAAVVGRCWYWFATGSPGSWTLKRSSGCWASPRCSQACCGSSAGSLPRSGLAAAGRSAGSCSARWSSRSVLCCC